MLNVTMYLRADGTSLTQQRTLALYVVALRRCRWGHNESWRESLCTCMVLKGVAGDTMKVGVRAFVPVWY